MKAEAGHPKRRACNETSRIGVWDDPPLRPSKEVLGDDPRWPSLVTASKDEYATSEVHEDLQEQGQEDTSPPSAKAGTLRAEAPEFVPAPAAEMSVQMIPWQMVPVPLTEAMQLMPMPGPVPGLVLPPLNLPLPEPGLASGEATPSPRDLADDLLTQQMEP